MPDPLSTYLGSLSRKLATQDTTEHTHRAALEALLEALGGSGVTALNEPRRIACGAPDFRVLRGPVTLGYVEAKDVGVDLAREEAGEQLKRYRGALDNLVLTDYLEFRHYVGGEPRAVARLAHYSGGHASSLSTLSAARSCNSSCE